MTADYYPLQVLLLTVSGWVNREQQRTIEYPVEENRILEEQIKGRKLRLNDTQRPLLAAKGKQLGRRLLNCVATIVTPDTIMRWHRRLIAARWTHPRQRKGRRGVMREITRLVVRLAMENSRWGYTRIQGSLKDLGHRVGRTTVSRILKSEGIKPAPDRPSSWRTFLEAHRGEIAAAGFFTTDVRTRKGLVTYYTLFVVDLKTRRVHSAGSSPHPGEAFMEQVAGNLTDAVDGLLYPRRFLIVDRDSKFTDQFRRTSRGAGVETVLTPYRAPNCNASAERFVRSIKEECLNRLIFSGESSLRRTLREYVAHYHRERPHQGLANEVIQRAGPRPTSGTEVRCQDRWGGRLRYSRPAA